jgi:hypothetical protein
MNHNKSLKFAEDYWGLFAAVIGPPFVLSMLILVGIVSWPELRPYLSSNWGNIASVWGLLVGVYVLVVAKGAKRAAEEATSKERERSLVEELDEAKAKIQQVGLFARDGKWDVVLLRAEEVLSSCRSILARWGEDYLSEDPRNMLLTVSTLVRSIADVAAESSVRNLSDQHRRDVLRAQLDASELISSVVGQSRKVQEKGGS